MNVQREGDGDKPMRVMDGRVTKNDAMIRDGNLKKNKKSPRFEAIKTSDATSPRRRQATGYGRGGFWLRPWQREWRLRRRRRSQVLGVFSQTTKKQCLHISSRFTSNTNATDSHSPLDSSADLLPIAVWSAEIWTSDKKHKDVSLSYDVLALFFFSKCSEI